MFMGSAASTVRRLPRGSSPSFVRRKSAGAPVAHACGLHAVRVLDRELRLPARVPAKASGKRQLKNFAACRMPAAMVDDSSRYPPAVQ